MLVLSLPWLTTVALAERWSQIRDAVSRILISTRSKLLIQYIAVVTPLTVGLIHQLNLTYFRGWRIDGILNTKIA